MKNKTTKSKKLGVFSWLMYFLSLLLGIFNQVDFALIGFLISYITLFLWVVHYETSQLDKGLLMVLSGTCFVVLLTTAAGLEVKEGRIFDVPKQLELSFVGLVAIAGATFFGAGGSVIANVATEHSSDSPVNIDKENKLLLAGVEGRLKAIYRMLCALIILVSMSAVALGCLIMLF